MNNIRVSFFVFLAMLATASFSQDEANTPDSTGLPGDNFSLQGALDLFKSSSSLEEFEKKLNYENNAVNNLDLNGDGDIDYVRVVDNMKDNAHAIVLQVPVSETESQDVAVIELETKDKESAIVQIIGDEELYGEKEIVEPFEEKEGVEQGKSAKGPMAPSFMPIIVVVNVWHWPCVKYVYAPAYVIWVSPWKWHYFPPWWKPWKVHPWRWHHKHCMHYHDHFHRVNTHRVVMAHKVYSPHRKTSVLVKTKYKPAHASYKARKVNPKPAGNVKSGKPASKPATHAAPGKKAGKQSGGHTKPQSSGGAKGKKAGGKR